MQQKFDDSNCYLSSGPGTTPFGGLGLSIVSIHPGGILEFESVARQEAGRSFVRQSRAKEVVNLTDYAFTIWKSVISRFNCGSAFRRAGIRQLTMVRETHYVLRKSIERPLNHQK